MKSPMGSSHHRSRQLCRWLAPPGTMPGLKSGECLWSSNTTGGGCGVVVVCNVCGGVVCGVKERAPCPVSCPQANHINNCLAKCVCVKRCVMCNGCKNVNTICNLPVHHSNCPGRPSSTNQLHQCNGALLNQENRNSEREEYICGFFRV